MEDKPAWKYSRGNIRNMCGIRMGGDVESKGDITGVL